MEQVADTLLRRAHTALWDAAPLEPVLAEMAAAGVSIDPLLLSAAHGNRPDAITTLLAHGASVNATDDRGRTALHYAASRAHVECVRLLLERGASVHAQDRNGRTPIAVLIMCSASKKSSMTCECANTLLSNGAQLPPHHVVWDLMWSEARWRVEWTDEWHRGDQHERSRFVQLLLDNHVDPNAVDPDTGDTALHVLKRDSEWWLWWLRSLKLLLQRGAAVNARNAKGQTPLLICMCYRSTACLLAYGADVNLALPSGWTPLMMAVDSIRCSETVAVLLRHKADPSVAHLGCTALNIAYKSSHCAYGTQRERDQAAECTRVLATWIRNQQAEVYGGALLKAGFRRDVRALMMHAFCEMFTVEGAIDMQLRNAKRIK